MSRRPAFDEYVAARSSALLRFAYVLCGDRHLAEDLVQEVLIKAHRRWSSIEADDPEGYLKRALVRTHVSWVRRRSSTEVATSTFHDSAHGAGLDDAHASRDEMWSLLARLPRAQRAVLVLRYFEDLDDHRIAEVVGVSQSTVRVHAHRGLNTLREALAERAAQAPPGAGLAEQVERGVRRAAVRRRVVAAGGVAALVAAVALLIPLLRPVDPQPPIGPTPSVSVSPTSDIDLVPTPLSAPVFPYRFTALPPNLAALSVTLVGGRPMLSYGGDDTEGSTHLSVRMNPERTLTGDPGDTVQVSTVSVNGIPATQWFVPADEVTWEVVELEWPQDGWWFLVSGSRGGITPEQVRLFAESMAPGTTEGVVAGLASQLAAVAWPVGFELVTLTPDEVCAAPEGDRSFGLCVRLDAFGPGDTGEALTVDGLPARTYQVDGGNHLMVDRRPEGFVEIGDRGQYGLTIDDLIAIYQGISFRG